MKMQFLRSLHLLPCLCMMYFYLELAAGETIDEVIASSSTAVTDFDFLSDIAGAELRVELDMILSTGQYSLLYGNTNTANNAKSSPRKKRKALQSLTGRWSKKEIPYNIQTATFTTRESSEIYKAIDEWQINTCIRFRKATSSDLSYVNFENGSGCSSRVGMVVGKQAISLARGCRSKDTIVHEIGHAVGFFHEQNRPDRDSYVVIKKENIEHPSLYSNFDKYSWSTVSIYGVPYDYTSIMHYGGTAFSGNDKYTIQTKDPAYQEIIGTAKGLSFNDIKLANLMYNCSERCQSSIRCPKDGFVGKDCQCWCPGNPVRKCEGTSIITQRPVAKTTTRFSARTTVRPYVRSTARPTTATCSDKNSYCPAWSKSGYCQTSYYVKTYCKASCLLCGVRPTPTNTCMNTRRHCTSWGNKGYCTGMFSAFMSTNCPETCGLCRKNVLTGTAVLKSDPGERADSGANKFSSGLLTFLCGVFKYCAKI